MLSCCVFVPLGPRDHNRVHWAINSIRKNCTNYRIFILVDGPNSSLLNDDLHSTDSELIFSDYPSDGHWGKIWQMQNRGFAAALARDDLEPDCVFLRLEPDALIIRPGLIEKAQTIFSRNPQCGQIGQIHFNLLGNRIENIGWVHYWQNRTKMFGILKAFVLMLREHKSVLKALADCHHLHTLVDNAKQNGYTGAEFGMGAYFLRPDVARRMNDAGLLFDSPMQWFSRVGDDVMMTLHVYAVGFKAFDSIGPDGIFAVTGKEPLIHPLDLKVRGNYIVHSTKYGVTKSMPVMTEEELLMALLYES